MLYTYRGDRLGDLFFDHLFDVAQAFTHTTGHRVITGSNKKVEVQYKD